MITWSKLSWGSGQDVNPLGITGFQIVRSSHSAALSPSVPYANIPSSPLPLLVPFKAGIIFWYFSSPYLYPIYTLSILQVRFLVFFCTLSIPYLYSRLVFWYFSSPYLYPIYTLYIYIYLYSFEKPFFKNL